MGSSHKSVTLNELVNISEKMHEDIIDLVVKIPLIVSERYKPKRMNRLKKIDLFYNTPIKI